MNKKEFIKKVADTSGISKRDTALLLESMISTITETLVEGGKIKITGFGTFEVKKIESRAGVNPQTGAKIKIPAMRRAKFKAGKTLKEAVK